MLTERTAWPSGRFSFDQGCRIMLKIVFLTNKFYSDHKGCPEIRTKERRPYVCVQVVVNGVLWAIPMRSHISHEYAIWTDKEQGHGIDFTKAVAICKMEEYISAEKPYIRPNEFAVLKRINKHTVIQKFLQYIKVYKDAKAHMEVPRNKQLVRFSTLQYFEKYI